MKTITLRPGMLPVCIFQQVNIDEIALSKQFAVDVFQTLTKLKCLHISHETIAVDLFNGACSRETITRACSGARADLFRPVTSYAIIGALLLRSPIPRTMPFSGRRSSFMAGERQAVLELLYLYGVQCADGSCCGLARYPLTWSASTAVTLGTHWPAV